MSTPDDDGILRPGFAGGDVPAPPAESPIGAEQRVSDPDDATTRPDEIDGVAQSSDTVAYDPTASDPMSLEGPDVETSIAPGPADPDGPDTPVPDAPSVPDQPPARPGTPPDSPEQHAGSPETDPLDPTPIADPDLGAPSED